MDGAGADDADELMEDEVQLHIPCTFLLALQYEHMYVHAQTALHSDAEEPHTAQLSISAEDSSSHNANAKIVGNSILLGQIDPILWKQETERVASKLISGACMDICVLYLVVLCSSFTRAVVHNATPFVHSLHLNMLFFNDIQKYSAQPGGSWHSMG